MDESYVLITGGSGGIGYELAKLFAADKFNLILAARNADKLNEASAYLKEKYGVDVKAIPKDLSITSAAEELFDEIKSQSLTVETVVNNAGFGANISFSEMPLDEAIEMIEVNVTSLVKLTKLFLTEMVRRRKGGILNIASTASFAPGPYMSIYYATKAFVLSFTEGIAEELKGSGVKVMAACPGPVKTGFQKRAGLQRSKMFTHQNVLSASKTAKIIYKRFRRKRVLTIIGLTNFIGVQAIRTGPRIAVRKITKWLNKKRPQEK